MTRISTGEGGDHDIHYENHEMSVSMKILKARLCQILIENKFFDWRLDKAFFVYFYKNGGDSGYEFCVPSKLDTGNTHKIFKIHEKIREYYKGGIEIELDYDEGVYGFTYKTLDKSAICKECKGKKFIREDGFGYIEPCQSCNSEFHLPFLLS